MNAPQPERRRTKTTYGVHSESGDGQAQKPSSELPDSGSSLRRLAISHPFTQQLDVVFPASDVLKEKLSVLSAEYRSRTWTLAEFAAFAQPHVQRYTVESDLIAIGKPGHLDDDVWCLDTRGLLTLAICKTTYEKLGLVGRALPWKEHQDVYIVRVSLHAQAPALANETVHVYGPKVQAALAAWDQRRGAWNLIACGPANLAEAAGTPTQVQPAVRTLQNVFIPKPKLHARPKDPDAAEEWDEDVAALFEWVGLACLGSERLRVYDKPDPYIAVYTPPSPNYTGTVLHMRWAGLLSPQFVQSVIDIASEAPFACVVANSVVQSPVTYTPRPPSMHYPVRAPRAQSEDTWSVMMSRREGSSDVDWLLAASIGKWDSRWG